MSVGQVASASGVTGGTSSGSTGSSARCGFVEASTCAGPSPGSSSPNTLVRTTAAATTGTRTAAAMIATRRNGSSGGACSWVGAASLGGSSVRSASEVDDRAGQRAGDAVDRLDAGNDEPAELVDALGLGPDDDVVGTGDILGLNHAGDLTDGLGDLGGLADLGLDEDVGVDHGKPFLGQRCRCVVPAGWRTGSEPTAATR